MGRSTYTHLKWYYIQMMISLLILQILWAIYYFHPLHLKVLIGCIWRKGESQLVVVEPTIPISCRWEKCRRINTKPKCSVHKIFSYSLTCIENTSKTQEHIIWSADNAPLLSSHHFLLFIHHHSTSDFSKNFIHWLSVQISVKLTLCACVWASRRVTGPFSKRHVSCFPEKEGMRWYSQNFSVFHHMSGSFMCWKND